jgi:invasion protein IalB
MSRGRRCRYILREWGPYPMMHRFGTAAGTRALACVAMAVAVGFASQSSAQQPAPKAPPAQKGAAPKAQPAQKGPPAGTTQPSQQQAQQAQPGPQGEQPKLNFSPWTKVCPKGSEANAKQVCLTGRDGTVETGMPVVAAVLIEPEGQPKKVLRVTLPLGMALQPGTRVVIDQGQPMNAPYVICAPNGCMSDYEASGELISNMKKGKGLAVQGINGSGQMVTLVLPLTDFAKAYDGPPMDPKAFEDLQRKRYEESQKHNQGQ